MAEPRFEDTGGCVFDAYGTLLDFASALAPCGDALGDKAAPLAALWRQKQLEYSWVRTLTGRYADFWHLTSDSLDVAMATLGIEDPALRAHLMQRMMALEAFPDVAETLKRLKAAGLKTAILSNGSPSMLVASVKSAGLSLLVDQILSVDGTGAYKPAPAVYQLPVDALKLPLHALLYVSANGWDASGAAAFGYRTVWLNRTGAPADPLPGEPAAEIASLAGLPALLGV